ncbi:MAG: hypothetical protein K0Q95_399 [Bacteroidota bacterium]|jgi:hypothetical protein|nr:hypothetical protein [Bacteroidota bacterium]
MRYFIAFFLFTSSFVSAQVTDNFSDGDFTSSPSWTGDASEFIVNASQQLQLNNTVAGASYLSTASPAASLSNIEWHFYIKQTFAPSSGNYARVYLASDQANLEGPLNGYYLQFGEAGSLDAVELFRQTGTTSISVARGANGQIAASFAIGVKVTRDASGNWSLFVDPAGGTAYSQQAAGTDNTYTATSFFGVAAVYTSSNANKFFFDDFYNGAIIVDTTPPVVNSASVISATQLDVLFSETVDPTTAQTGTNYSANNGLGSPVAALRDGSNLSLVHLTFGSSFTSGLTNALSVSNIQDLSGNLMTSSSTPFTYYAPVTPGFKDIIITEIMADPTPQIGLPAFEFVEIYNRGTNTFNLNAWKLTDGSSTATLGNYNLVAGQYLIICPVADTALFSPFGPTMGVSSFPSLNNSGDNIYLKDNALGLIDSVNFSDTWYHDAVKADGGWTLELINPNSISPCARAGNWTASNNSNGGTPGTQNSVYSLAPDVTAPAIAAVTVNDSTHITVCFSEGLNGAQISALSNYSINNGIGTPLSVVVNSEFSCVDLTLATMLNTSTTYSITVSNMSDCAGNTLTPNTASFDYYKAGPFDVVINEIMADPDNTIGSVDIQYEYVELHNRTPYTINLNNWKYTAGTNTKTIPNVNISGNGYVVLSSTTNAALLPASANAVGVTSFPGLTNTGSSLVLRNPLGVVISTVSYTDAWYQDAAKKEGGWSIEQIDPNNPCAGMANWRASVDPDGGTPGSQNSVNASYPDNTPPAVTRVSVIAADTIRLYFNEPLDSMSMRNTSLYTIDNSMGSPIQAVPVGPDFKSVRLTLGTAILPGIIYKITVNNSVTDCIGNQVGADNSARFAIPQPAAANDLVINEVLYDPKTDGVDFVEIFNRSNKVIDLKNMTIAQYDTINHVPMFPQPISPDGYLLFPGDYLVLSENGNAIQSQYYTPDKEAFLDIDALPSLNITGGTVCLAVGFLVVDHFTYYENMQFPLLNETKGVSLERIDFERPSQDYTNWHSAAETVGFATPGYKNSQYNDAGETSDAIEITPEVFSPDEDGMNDVENINYHFDTPGYVANVIIYDSKGRLVKNLIRNELLGINGTFSWDGITDEKEKARIGIYIIFTEVFDVKGNVKHFKKTCVLAGKL